MTAILRTLHQAAARPAVLLQIVSIGLILGILVTSAWGIRFQTHDDAVISMWRLNYPNAAWDLATGQGRIYFLYHTFFIIFCDSLWASSLYDVVQFGCFTLALIGTMAVLGLYVSWAFACVTGLFYLSSLALLWDHTLMASIPLYHHVVVVTICASLLALYRFRVQGGRWWRAASLALFALALVGQEYQMVIALVLYSAAVLARLSNDAVDQGWRQRIERSKGLLATAWAFTGFYLIMVIAWRLYWGNNYEGGDFSLKIFDLGAALGILTKWSVSANIFFYWLWPDQIGAMLGRTMFISTISMSPSTIFSSLTGTALLKTAAVVVGLTAVLRDRAAGPAVRSVSRDWWFLPLLALAIMVTPSFLLALTPKYQAWFRQGFQAYTYTSLSAYGVAILVSWLFFTVLRMIRHSVWRSAVMVSFVVLMALGAVTSAHHNAVVGSAMRDATARWRAVDLLMASPLRDKIENSILVAPRLGDYYWSVPTDDKYWQDFLQTFYRSQAVVKEKLDAGLVRDANRPLFYLDFFRSAGSDQIAVLLSPVTVEGGRLIAHETWVISRSPWIAGIEGRTENGKAFIRWLPQNAPDHRDRFFVYHLAFPAVNAPDLRLTDRIYWAHTKYLGSTTYTLGDRIGFGIDDEPPAAAKVSGWSDAEATHTWAVGPESVLAVSPTASPQCALTGRLRAWGFVPPGKAPQTLDILVNGQPVWSGAFGEERTVGFDIPLAAWQAAAPVRLTLRHPGAVSPASQGVGSDVRPLAIAVRELTINDCAPVTPAAALYRFGSAIDFTATGNAGPFKTAGWSTPEADRTWTEGPESTLTFATARVPSCDLTLAFPVTPFYVRDRMPPPSLTVLVNDEPVFQARLEQDSQLEIPVKRSLWLQREPVTVRFLHPDATAPARVSTSTDSRVLGYSFKAMTIRETCPHKLIP